VDDCAHKHGKPFRKIATAVGLIGRMKSATAGPELAAIINTIATDLGPYPHARLDFTKNKQSTRMLKCCCPKCGYLARVAASWINKAGTPICPSDKVQMATERESADV
jgi:hypothetical protein